jgi:hypothetical protein
MRHATRRIIMAAVLGWAAGAAGQASAGTIHFSYSGTGLGTSMGSGSFTFADGLSTVNLSDLTAFNFSQTADFVGGVTTFSYGLGDLTTFTATVGTGPTLSSLSLDTGFVVPVPFANSSGALYMPEAFQVTSLATGGASTYSRAGTLTTGTVMKASAPEPATMSLAAVAALAGLGLLWCPRRAP